MTDFSKILSKYKKGWIALTSDNKKVVATGTTLKSVLEKSAKNGVKEPSIIKAAPIDNLFIG